MHDGNAKSDLERTAEKAVNTGAKSTKLFTILFGKFLLRTNRYYQKHFSSSMKALRNDGPTKELYVSPALTKSEVKQIITAGRENNILMGVKKMQPDGELGRNKSLHQQEKLAKNEIKYRKWNERRKTIKKIPILYHFCKNQAEKYRKLSIQDEKDSNEEKYVIIFNKSKMGFLNEQLKEIPKNRLKRMKEDGLDDINNDGIIDIRDCELKAPKGMNLKVEELNEIGEDFGSCLVKDYQSNYCTQRITKEDYCDIREELFNLKSHGACVVNDIEVLVAVPFSELSKYKMFAPKDRPIKIYGEKGGRSIETESNANDIIELELNGDKEYNDFMGIFKEKDFFAEVNHDGKTTALVREVDAQEILEKNKKKATVDELVKEANNLEKQQDIEITKNNNTLEREEEIDR